MYDGKWILADGLDDFEVAERLVCVSTYIALFLELRQLIDQKLVAIILGRENLYPIKWFLLLIHLLFCQLLILCPWTGFFWDCEVNGFFTKKLKKGWGEGPSSRKRV